ncbi:MAG: hypothetical protein ACYDAK_12905 [Candidatus Limnocylindrales bacterium]
MNMTAIYDTSGNIMGYYDDNMLFYDVNQNPITDASGQQLLYDPTTNSAIDPATAYGGPPVDSTQVQTVSTYTPPSTFDPNAIVKLLNGQTFKYDATGANPVPYNASAPTMSKWLLWGGLGLVGYIALSGGGSSSRGRGGRR